MSDGRYKTFTGFQAANLNGAQNSTLALFTANGPAVIVGFGVVADAAVGLLAPSVLKLRRIPQATGVPADIAGETLTVGSAVARGDGVFKRASSRIEVQAGDEIALAVETPAGGASTGDVWIEYEQQPFAGTLISNYTEKTA